MHLPCAFSLQEFEIVAPQRLAKFFIDLPKSIEQSKNNITILRLNSRKSNLYPKLKELMEYKYGIPMPILNYYQRKTKGASSFIEIIPYVSNRILRLIYSHFPSKDCNNIHKFIEKTNNASICIYAAGAIEKAPDHGVEYREILKKHFALTNIKIIDPCDFQYNKEVSSITEYISLHGIGLGYTFSKMVGHNDVAIVKKCDAVIIYIDQHIGAGSISECTVAKSYGKPVYGIISSDYDIKNIHPWLLGQIDRYFLSFQTLREFMINV